MSNPCLTDKFSLKIIRPTPHSLHVTSKAFCNPSSSNNLVPSPSNSSYISNSLSSLDCSGREKYCDLASFLAIAVSIRVDAEVEGALSSPVATVINEIGPIRFEPKRIQCALIVDRPKNLRVLCGRALC